MRQEIMNNLAQLLDEDELFFYPPYVWLFTPKNSELVVKIESAEKDNILVVNAGFAKDGSGPLQANFLSTLMIEDIQAPLGAPLGVCSGKASVTIYHLLDISKMDGKRFHRFLMNFEQIADWVFSFVKEGGHLGEVSDYDNAPQFIG